MRFKVYLWLLVALFCSGAFVASLRANTTKPNVLFIIVDDLMPRLGTYGDPQAVTPNMDKLGSAGTVFERAYAQQALCSPSRVSFLTGLRPDAHYEVRTSQRMRTLNPDVVTLPEFFAQNGYRTKGMGKVFDGRTVVNNDEPSWTEPYYSSWKPAFPDPYGSPAGHHYQEPKLKEQYANKWEALSPWWMEAKRLLSEGMRPAVESVDLPDIAYFDGLMGEEAVQYIKRQSSSSQDKPFFLSVGFIKPHLPFVAPKKYWDLYDRNSFELASQTSYPIGAPEVAYNSYHEIEDYNTSSGEFGNFSAEVQRELIHGYMACVSYVDAQVGKLMTALTNAELAKNTIIVLVGDHGFHLGDKGEWGKHTNYEEATRVPLIVYAPGMPRDVRYDGVVELVDIFPTLNELAGLPSIPELAGESFVPALKGNHMPQKSNVAISQYIRKGAMGYAIRDERYRYVEWREAGTDRKSVDEVTGNIVARELYDYGEATDSSGEGRNLIDLVEYAPVVDVLQAKMNDELEYLVAPK
ncbi:sulfatase [Coraliomargarita sp. SDUM461004]|uniref:Sulfatase n=1 Tax=Thalassobacterium sedimentorum TaxID=3041258 RepID=A0ABU1AEF1_9BACT|nr:sulfatase [Coraliomargarita sp. SDUM461004]MDQ8193019.1 sulfatase [Coraliomargarita sp. SDUM461004]